MELIPILSLIILVATISTFILAVGAYILYKIRERKGKNIVAEQPATIEAELVTPTKVVAETRTTRGGTVAGEPIYTRSTRSEAKYATEPDAAYATAPREARTYYTAAPRERETREARTYAPRETRDSRAYARETRETRPEVTRYAAPRQRYTSGESERYTSTQKFRRYTNPYDEPATKEVKKEESLRWR